MNPLTHRQAATLIARFFGFYLLFCLAFNLTELPSYWLRSNFSRDFTHSRISHDASYDVSLVMFCVRQLGYSVFGLFFFLNPRKLAGLLMESFDDRPA